MPYLLYKEFATVTLAALTILYRTNQEKKEKYTNLFNHSSQNFPRNLIPKSIRFSTALKSICTKQAQFLKRKTLQQTTFTSYFKENLSYINVLKVFIQVMASL